MVRVPRQERNLLIGDHIFYHTHKGFVQHHGIWTSRGFVIHIDDAADTDQRYMHCAFALKD